MSVLIVAYLFLGGAGAGAFAVLACIDFLHLGTSSFSFTVSRRQSTAYPNAAQQKHLSHMVKRGYIISFVTLALGAVCLLADLGRPEIAYMLFTRPTLSYISIGTFLLTALLVCSLYFALIGTVSLPSFFSRIKTVMLVIGFVSALCVMTYTGVFLQSLRSIALWNSPFLIALFFLSALSTGMALVMLCSGGIDLRRSNARILQRLSGFDCAIIVAESIVCIVYLAAVASSVLGAQSVRRLVIGDTAVAFMVGFVLCGLIVPGVLNAVFASRRHAEWIEATTACSVLVGGFCLRLSLFEARIHSSM